MSQQDRLGMQAERQYDEEVTQLRGRLSASTEALKQKEEEHASMASDFRAACMRVRFSACNLAGCPASMQCSVMFVDDRA